MQQKLRFNKREKGHRSFIRAFLFDYIFKIFIQLLDESLCHRDKLIQDKKDEWEYFAERRANDLEVEIATLKKNIVSMKESHAKVCDGYEHRILQLKQEQLGFQDILNDYKYDMNQLTNFDVREDKVLELRKQIREAHKFIGDAEAEMERQANVVKPVLSMINIVAKDPCYFDAGTQTDCQINCNMAHVLTQVDSKSLQDFANTSMSNL